MNFNLDALIDDGSCEFPECIGDLTGDFVVSVADILEILGEYGCVVNCAADLNGDDSVTVEDLLIVLAHFGMDCPQ